MGVGKKTTTGQTQFGGVQPPMLIHSEVKIYTPYLGSSSLVVPTRWQTFVKSRETLEGQQRSLVPVHGKTLQIVVGRT